MLPREKPSEGRSGRRNWSNQKLRKPPTLTAWVTGSCVWVQCHHVYESRPCRQVLTKGKMACGVDHGRYPLRDLGYVPLLLAGGYDGFVVVQGYTAQAIATIIQKPGQQVVCTREPGGGKPVLMQRCLNPDPMPGGAEYLTDPVEFDACLFRVWGDAELALHFGIRGVRNRPQYPDRVKLDVDDDGEGSDVSGTGRCTMPRAENGEQLFASTDAINNYLKQGKNGKH